MGGGTETTHTHQLLLKVQKTVMGLTLANEAFPPHDTEVADSPVATESAVAPAAARVTAESDW